MDTYNEKDDELDLVPVRARVDEYRTALRDIAVGENYIHMVSVREIETGTPETEAILESEKILAMNKRRLPALAAAANKAAAEAAAKIGDRGAKFQAAALALGAKIEDDIARDKARHERLRMAVPSYQIDQVQNPWKYVDRKVGGVPPMPKLPAPAPVNVGSGPWSPANGAPLPGVSVVAPSSGLPSYR